MSSSNAGWKCRYCGSINNSNATKCSICMTNRPHDAPPVYESDLAIFGFGGNSPKNTTKVTSDVAFNVGTNGDENSERRRKNNNASKPTMAVANKPKAKSANSKPTKQVAKKVAANKAASAPNKSNATDGVRASDSNDDSSTESTAASSSLSSTGNYNDRKRIRNSNDDPRSSRRQALLPLTLSSVNQQNNGDNVSSSVIDCGATDICTQQQSSQSSPHHDAITSIQLFTIKSGSETFGDESYEINYNSDMTVQQVVQLISNALPFEVVWGRLHRLLSSSNSAYLNDHIHSDKTLKSMTGGQNPRLYLWILEPWEQLRWTTCGGLEGVREQNGLPTERWKEPVTQAKPITKNIRGRGDNSRVSFADAMSIV